MTRAVELVTARCNSSRRPRTRRDASTKTGTHTAVSSQTLTRRRHTRPRPILDCTHDAVATKGSCAVGSQSAEVALLITFHPSRYDVCHDDSRTTQESSASPAAREGATDLSDSRICVDLRSVSAVAPAAASETGSRGAAVVAQRVAKSCPGHRAIARRRRLHYTFPFPCWNRPMPFQYMISF